MIRLNCYDGNFLPEVRGAPTYFADLEQRKVRHKCVMTIFFLSIAE